MPPLLSIFAGPVFFEFDFDWKPPKRKRDSYWEGVGKGGNQKLISTLRHFDISMLFWHVSHLAAVFVSLFVFFLLVFRYSVYANEIIDLFWYRFAFEDIERVPHKTWNRITFDPQGSRMPIYRNVNFLTSSSPNLKIQMSCGFVRDRDRCMIFQFPVSIWI